MAGPTYFDAMDYPAIRRDYPVEGFLDAFRGLSADELRARQEARFATVMAFAWKVPFYRRLWGAAGIEPLVGGIEVLEPVLGATSTGWRPIRRAKGPA